MLAQAVHMALTKHTTERFLAAVPRLAFYECKDWGRLPRQPSKPQQAAVMVAGACVLVVPGAIGQRGPGPAGRCHPAGLP